MTSGQETADHGTEEIGLGIPRARTATRRRYLMCRPEHFTVSYEINPWMDASRPTVKITAWSCR